jgi:hypothetical protein
LAGPVAATRLRSRYQGNRRSAARLFHRSVFTCPLTVGILGDQVLKGFLRGVQLPVLTRERVRLAYAIAVTTDVVQLLLGPFGWAFADELLDVTAMILIWRLIGFHPLLLPTFVLKFVPVADMLPTWTGCVAIVVALRKRQQASMSPPPGPGSVIDV